MSGIILGGLLLYLPSWTAEKAFFSEQQFKAVYDGSAELAERFYADVRFDSTVQHFIESIAARELRRIPDFGKSSEAEREALYEKIEAQVAETVRSSFGSGFNTDQTLREALYAFLLSLLNEWKASLGSEFLVAWTAGAFLLFRGIGVIFYFAAAVMAFLIYQLMLAANIVYVQGENHIREVVRFT